MKPHLFSALLCVLSISSLSAATYYVSPGGNDSANGTTTGTAWKTVSKVNNATLSAGDIVRFEGGQTFTGTTLNPKNGVAGTSTNPVTFTSYGTGRATIAQTSLTAVGADVSGHNYIKIDNLDFTGAWNTALAADSATPYGIIIKGTGTIISNSSVSGFRGGGIQIGTPSSNTTLTYVDVTNVGDYGIMTVWGNPSQRNVTDTLIDHCRVWNVKGRNNYNNHSGSGITLFMCNRAIVQYCEVWNTGWGFVNPGTGGPVGIWAAESSNVTYQFNESHHNKNGTGNVDGGGFDFDGGCVNCLAQYNYSHDNDGPAMLVAQYSGASPLSNIVWRYNISENDARAVWQGAIDVWSGGGTVDNVRYYGNIVYASSVTNKIVNRSGSAVTNFKFHNNIFLSTGGRRFVSGQGASFYMQGNLYWALDGNFNYDGGTSKSLAAWRAATGQEKNGSADTGIEANPLVSSPGTVGNFANGDVTRLDQLGALFTAYRLAVESPARDAGLDLTQAAFGSLDMGTQDFFGNAIPQGASYDIGAHEATPQSSLGFTSATFSQNEGNSGTSNAVVAVTRIGSGAGSVSISYATSDGTAVAGTDYTATAGSLTWADGEVGVKNILVPVIGDTTPELDETVTLTLSNPTNGALLGVITTATLVIVNDDPVAEIEVNSGGTPVVNGSTILASHIPPGTTQTLLYTIANNGNAPLNLGTLSLSGISNAAVSITTAPASTVTPSGSTTLVLSVTPTTNGNWTAMIDFTTNDLGNPAFSWTLSGPSVAPRTPLFWGGGTSTPTNAVNTTSISINQLAGTWNHSTANWNVDPTVTSGYQQWIEGSTPHFKSRDTSNGGSPDVALASDFSVAGIIAEFLPPHGQQFDLISDSSATRTITLGESATIEVRSTVSGTYLAFRRAGHVSGRGAAELGGTSGFTFNGLSTAGLPNSTARVYIDSATVSGPVLVNSGVLRVGTTATGALGMNSVSSFDVIGNLSTLQLAYATSADNRMGDATEVMLANSQLSLLAASDTVAPTETIGRLTIQGSGMLVTHLARSTSTVVGTLTLASGMERGTNTKGVLVTANANTYGGLGVTAGGLRVTGHGIPANTLLPWGFNFGRAQLIGGDLTSATSVGFLATDSTGELRVRPSVAGNATLSDASWQSFTATSDVTMTDAILSGSLAGNVNARSLAIGIGATSTFGMGGRQLAVGSLGFGAGTTRNLTLGANDATRGTLTAPAGLSELYLIHRRPDTGNTSTFILNSIISDNGSPLDVIFGGPNGQFQINSATAHTGQTYLNAGQVKLNTAGSLATTSAIHFSSGAQLDVTAANWTLGSSTAQILRGGGHTPGIGNVKALTRNVTIAAGSTVNPGYTGSNAALRFEFTSGKLAFATGSTLALDLSTSSASDRIAFAGVAGDTLATTGQPTLALTLGAGFDYSQTYQVIENVNTSGFSFAAITGYNTSQYTAAVSKVGSSYVLSFNPSSPYTAWSEAQSWNGGDSSPGADPNHDGITNLLAYALDISPVVAANPAHLPQMAADFTTPGGPWLNFIFRENPLATDLTYTVRSSTDLQGWNDVTIDNITTFLEIADPNPDGDNSALLMRLRMKYDPTTSPNLFLRLRIAD